MKNKIHFLFFLMFSVSYFFVKGQDLQAIKYSDLDSGKTYEIPLDNTLRDKIMKDPSEVYNLIITNISPGFLNTLKASSKPMTYSNASNSASISISNDLKNFIENQTYRNFYIKEIKPDLTSIDKGTIKVTWEKIITRPINNREKLLSEWRMRGTFANPYNNRKDQVDLYFNDVGKLLNNMPVNVDQSDVFVFHVLAPEEDKEKYSIKVIEGDYSPSDLSIRPFDAIIAHADNGEESTSLTYIEFITKKGPFTTDHFRFQISYDDTTAQRIYSSDPYSVKINKLYHVGVGVSFVSTFLSNPDFNVSPLNDTANTIIATNTGNRTLFTFNVIWYWSVFQNPKGSIITEGRDILKDEPAFTMKRVFPTFGVSLDGNFNENFFLGAAYEFARGGSFVAGFHYGKVQKLADSDFKLGETVYTGTQDDIVKINVWKGAFFIGINVDTRIFNTLFGRGQ